MESEQRGYERAEGREGGGNEYEGGEGGNMERSLSKN